MLEVTILKSPMGRNFWLTLGVLLVVIVGMICYYRTRLPERAKPPTFVLGKYIWSEIDFGASLTLQQDGRYEWKTFSDVRQPDEERIHHGYFQVQNDIITFTSDSKKPDPLPYYIVPWDKRLYLITEGSSSGFHSFASAIRSGEEPCINSKGRRAFMVRMAPEETPVSTSSRRPSRYIPKGLPTFPPQFQHLLQGIQRVESKPKREKGTKKTEKH